MTLLSRYVLRRFLAPLAVGMAAFLVVFVVVDLVDRLSAFIDRDVPAATILHYYVWYLPTISVMVLPMAMLLACLFCIGGLGRHGELTAMKAAGLNTIRILSPVLILAFLISAGTHIFVDRVVPTANRRRSEIDTPGYINERLPRIGRRRTRVVMIGQQGRVISVGDYDPRRRVGHNVMLDIRSDGEAVGDATGGGRSGLKEKITAEKMTWEDDHWVFHSGEVRRFLEGREWVAPFNTMDGKDLRILPEDLGGRGDAAEYMTNAELSRFIRRKERFGSPVVREEVERHLRTSFPFANLVIVAFGLPLAARIRRTGRPLQVGICLLTSFVFYGCLQAGRALGWNGLLPPFWAAWAANVLFGFVGGVLLSRTHT